MKLNKWLMLIVIFAVGSTHAVLEITVVKKDKNAFPITVSPFKLLGDNAQDKDISKIIRDNLERSGRFNVFIPTSVIGKIDAKYWKEKI